MELSYSFLDRSQEGVVDPVGSPLSSDGEYLDMDSFIAEQEKKDLVTGIPCVCFFHVGVALLNRKKNESDTCMNIKQ